ncbi:MAG: acyl-CoA synthetase FdrA [Candidatus Hodarchaeota archaeon]
MSVVKTHIIQQEYRDSVQLMRAASSANKLEGIEIASVLMGTPKNKSLLQEMNLLTLEAENAEPNDIIITVRASSDTLADHAINYIIDILSQEPVTRHDETIFFRSIRGAFSSLPDANLAVISTPGEYAAREARLALEHNLNVLLFSDNVSLEDEITLKQEAHNRGLIIMGPDCGTAMIKSIGLGFSNVVLPGPIGIVAASGTGTQEVMALCQNRGVGVKHAIGTGSRDVMDLIGGISMIDGFQTLDRDPAIELIIIVSKPPEEKTMQKILDVVSKSSKPVIMNFLGQKAGYYDHAGKYLTVNTLEEAAYSATRFIQTRELKLSSTTFDDEIHAERILSNLEHALTPEQKYIRGLYAGGTFTFEAAIIISKILPSNEPLWTNVKLKGTKLIDDPKKRFSGHTLIDMGGEEYTLGKPHPMIDQFERNERFLKEIADPETAVILLDFILGHGSHSNPIADMGEVFEKWKAMNKVIPIVAHLCGTELDPQDYRRLWIDLENHGTYVMPTNAQAAKLSALIATRGKIGQLRKNV